MTWVDWLIIWLFLYSSISATWLIISLGPDEKPVPCACGYALLYPQIESAHDPRQHVRHARWLCQPCSEIVDQ